MTIKAAILIFIFAISITFLSDTAYASHNEQTSRETRDPRIAVSGSDVYAVWTDSTNPDYWDLYFTKSTDGGKTFSEVINLTNGSSFYPISRIIVSGNNVYILWEDRISPDGYDAAFFTKSSDGGVTFEKPRILDPSNDSTIITRPRVMFESNDVLYVLASQWYLKEQQNKLIFFISNDDGNTFSKPTIIFEKDQWEDFFDYKKSQDGTIFVMADDQKNYDEKGHLNLRKIFPDGSTSRIISVNGGDSAVTNAQLATSGDNVYVVWRQWEKNRWHHTFSGSNDGGETFSKPEILRTDPKAIDAAYTEGSSIFAYDESVFLILHDEYWDGQNQWFRIRIASSHNHGNDFEIKIHPLDEVLNQYSQILTLSQDAKLYSLAITTKNPPFNDAALFFTNSEDGELFSEPVDLLPNNIGGFDYLNVATQGKSIHLLSTGKYGQNCVLYVASHDGGDSFSEIQNLGPNGHPKECLGIQKKVESPKDQMKTGTNIEDIRCKEDLASGYILTLREKTKSPLCVKAVSYEKLLERSVISKKSFETIALSAAKNFLLTHPKLSSINPESVDLQVYMTRHSIPPAFIIKGTFESKEPIYNGDPDPKHHSVELMLALHNQIHDAKIDDSFLLTKEIDKEQFHPRLNLIVSPTIKTILVPNEKINNKGLLPLVITEVSEGGFDKVTYWTFQSIGYNGDNRDKRWGFLPDYHTVSETVDENGDDAIDRQRMPENFGIPQPLFVFPLLCNGQERVEGESGWHYTLPTRTDAKIVYFRSTDKGILPDENGIYDIRFVSMFKTEVELPQNAQIITNLTMLCPFEQIMNDATHGYYTKLEFKFEDSPAVTKSESLDSTLAQSATILVKIFDDTYGFSSPEFHLKDDKINIEPAQPDLIHRNSPDATLGYFFQTIGIKLTQNCLVLPDSREFCSDSSYSLKFFVNDKEEQDVAKYLINEDDKILISYGSSEQEIAKQLEELESMAKRNYKSLEKLMTLDAGTVREGTFDEDLAFRTFEKLMTLDMKKQEERNSLEYKLSQKQYEYDTLVQQNAEKNKIDSAQNEIKQIQAKLNELASKKDQYTSEEIFERVNKLEQENIKMYSIGPELYEKLVSAKKTIVNEIPDSVPLASVQINPDTKQLEIVLQKSAQNNKETEQYKTMIDDVIPDDVLWTIIFLD